jgi:hypothetical protein
MMPTFVAIHMVCSGCMMVMGARRIYCLVPLMATEPINYA